MYFTKESDVSPQRLSVSFSLGDVKGLSGVAADAVVIDRNSVPPGCVSPGSDVPLSMIRSRSVNALR